MRKNLKFGKRGRQIESFMDDIISQLNNLGFHAHRNHAHRTYEGYYLEGEPFDYEIFANNQVHCFDTKENFSQPNHWALHYTGAGSRHGNAAFLRQLNNLYKCHVNGAKAYFLVLFGHEDSEVRGKLISFGADIIYRAVNDGQKRIHYSMGSEWNVNEIIYSKES